MAVVNEGDAQGWIQSGGVMSDCTALLYWNSE